MEDLLSRCVLERLGKIDKNVKVRTLDFVNSVIEEIRARVGLSESEEMIARSRVVDLLWELRRRGVLKFDDDLLYFQRVE